MWVGLWESKNDPLFFDSLLTLTFSARIYGRKRADKVTYGGININSFSDMTS